MHRTLSKLVLFHSHKTVFPISIISQQQTEFTVLCFLLSQIIPRGTKLLLINMQKDYALLEMMSSIMKMSSNKNNSQSFNLSRYLDLYKAKSIA